MQQSLPLKNIHFSDITPAYFCMENCSPGQTTLPSVHTYYLLYFAVSGAGIFFKNESSYTLSKGEGILLMPREPFHFKSSQENPFQYICIGFFGVRADQFISLIDLNSNNPVFSYSYCDDLLNYFNEAESSEYSVDFFALSFLYRFFAHMSARPLLSKNIYVSQAIEYIDRHIHKQVKIHEISQSLGISRAYLYKAFEEVLSQSPKEYLLNRKIQLAYELLKTSKKTIAETGEAVGYSDQFAFSKIFKSKYGLSPRDVLQGKDPHVKVIDEENGECAWPAIRTQERVQEGHYALLSSPYLDQERQFIEGWLVRSGYLGCAPLPRNLDISLLTDNGKKGSLSFWIFVENQCDITNWCIDSKDWIRFGSSLDWDTDFQYWLGWHEQIKQEGWNRILLPFGDSKWGHICGNPDYENFCSFSITLSVPHHIRVFIDDICVIP